MPPLMLPAGLCGLLMSLIGWHLQWFLERGSRGGEMWLAWRSAVETQARGGVTCEGSRDGCQGPVQSNTLNHLELISCSLL